MKPSFESVHAADNTSFLVRQFEEKRFSAPYHFHPEFELTLIVQGNGKRYTGSYMNDYTAGDLVLLGSNLPHCWKTDVTASKKSVSVVIQFLDDCMGKDFFLRPEMKSIHQLLNRSKAGIQFTGNTIAWRNSMMNVHTETNGFKRLSLFLNLLYDLSITRKYILLDQQSSHAELSGAEQKRIHAVVAYIVDNFQKEISLEKAATAANMTPPAFCKYFKRMTRKTFLEAVTDYRIDFATRQLINTEKSIAAIGFESGFNDLSNFHKTFRQRTHHSPLEYRKKFLVNEK